MAARRPMVYAFYGIPLNRLCAIIIGLAGLAAAYPRLSEYSLAKGITNFGDIAMFLSVYDKLDKGDCLKIAVIGGSVTVGFHVEAPFQFKGTWAQHVVNMLDIAYPCKVDSVSLGSHSLTVIAKGATPSVIWIDILAGAQENTLRDFDLVLVDTSMNDSVDPEQKPAVASFTEVLMALILQQTARVSVKRENQCRHNYKRAWTGTAAIWVGTSSQRGAIRWDDPATVRYGDATPAQVPVAFHHGVPFVSIMDALGPFRNAASKEWMDSHFFFDIHGHPAELGHKMVASVVVEFLKMQHEHLALAAPWADLIAVPYCPKPPRFNTPTTLDTYLDGSKVYINPEHDTLAKRNSSVCKDWSVYEDVPHKPGIISTTVGSSCELVVLPEELKGSTWGLVHVNALKSFEHMGVLGISIQAGSPVNGSCMAANERTQLNATTVDGYWVSHSSQPQRTELQYAMPTPQDAPQCLYIRLAVEECGRRENKAKIVSVLVLTL